MGFVMSAQNLSPRRDRFSRRDLFRAGAAAALASQLSDSDVLGASPAPALRLGADLYQSIGVRPLINCKGTYTIISGSLTLPEVKQAMLEASKHFVHLDELMEAVGRRLAELTGAESGIVTCGCAAALTHATAAAVAGADPEKIQRLPDLTGLKDEVIAPLYSRNVYDHAIRMLGVKIVDVENEQELRAAIGPRTALVMVLGSPQDSGLFGLEPIAAIARAHGVPVLVDAAAEDLTIPNVHLERGADLVAYSGGKALRGPQSAGLLLGHKLLVQAAWLHSAPHHAFGRPMKVGKEDIVGMLAAVEMWVRRDHQAEWATWASWLDQIARGVAGLPSLTSEVLQPAGLSNRSPRLVIHWDSDRLGITGEELERHLWKGDPRIALGGSTGNRRTAGESTVTIMPWQMQPGDAEVVAGVLRHVLSEPPRFEQPQPPAGEAAKLAGQWDLHLDFVLGSAEHRLFFEQQAADLTGSHAGEMTSGDLSGWIEGRDVHFKSVHRYEGSQFGFEFHGQVEREAGPSQTMAGEVDLGEYGGAHWSARRRRFGEPDAPVRPVKNV